MSVRGFRNQIAAYVTKWLSNRPSLNTGFSVLYIFALVYDAMMEAAVEGVYAAMPGLGTPTALPYIGRSRGLIRGEADTDSSFGTKLRAWLDIWTCGTAIYPNTAALAQRIHEYLGNAPTVRIVDRAGNWVTVAGNGTITKVTGVPLHWDDVSNTERNQVLTPWWSDLWIVVYTPEWAQELRTLSAVAAAYGTIQAWGNARQLGTGQFVPRTPVDAILNLVWNWQGAHTNLRAIIFTYDATKFDPTNPSSMPDGTWGQWAVFYGGIHAPRRSTTAVYWIPPWSNPT